MKPDPSITRWFTFGRRDPEVDRRVRRLALRSGVQAIAVMPDVHPAGPVGTDTCVGVVMATSGEVYPDAVGEDIGCGMATVSQGTPSTPLGADAAHRLLAALRHAVPSRRHRQRQPIPLDTAALTTDRLSKLAERDGAVQLGTLGRGNHFLEVDADTEGLLWLTVHTGSRGMGGAVSREHGSPADGPQYLIDAAWCRQYAKANRRMILAQASALMTDTLGCTADWSTLVDADHNHVEPVTFHGEALMVHRKGANDASTGRRFVIAGSMGTRTAIAEGLGHADALLSSSHGAGRQLTRTEARAQISPQDFRRQMGSVYYNPADEPNLIEEAPAAYRDFRSVMRAQKHLARPVLWLTPLLIYKG